MRPRLRPRFVDAARLMGAPRSTDPGEASEAVVASEAGGPADATLTTGATPPRTPSRSRATGPARARPTGARTSSPAAGLDPLGGELAPRAAPPSAAAPALAANETARSRLLDLAGQLAVAASLTEQVDIALPVLAQRCHATVVAFAVAGSNAAGVRCWPPDLAWARALRDAFAAAWEVGPLTIWCRQVGVVPAVRIESVVAGWGTQPGMTLMHGGQVLTQLLVVPVACTGPIISGYFVARYADTFDDDELTAAQELQAVAVASHGRFLRPPEPSLTARQLAVLRLLAEGRTVRAIGSRLGIAGSTVDKHVRDLYRRLGTQDRASTVRAAQTRGLLDGLVGEEWQDLLIGGGER